MAGPLRFDGKVALVTGAGGGLGREYALAFAERGAKVVVNDLGGDIKGGGKSSRAADLVVDEIKAKGGTAVPNYDSVEDGEKLVKTALDNFGRIDIIVNNAGILRDRSFARISDLDWDLVQRVHLRGAFMVTRAAWPHMKNNNYGRIIMTSSTSGIYGNFGQANYGAAKMGLVGLSNTLSIEGAKYNIKCNSLAPTAGSRLTETVMPPDVIEALKPKYVVPVVLYLCHEDCPESGAIFECTAGWAAQTRIQRAEGAILRSKTKDMTAEDVRDNWDKITDFTNSDYPRSGSEAGGRTYQVMQSIENDEEPPAEPSSSSPNAAIGKTLPESSMSYTERDVILYALGVGVSTKEEDHLKFLFELSQEFQVLPSFGVILGSTGTNLMSVEGLNIDPTQILHGEQYLELYKPLPTSGKLTSRTKVADIMDKGRGAVILLDVETVDEAGEKVAFNQFSIFVQNMGGFGGKRSSDLAKPTCSPPSRAPDASLSEKTTIDQAALYRLSGDYNPLHIDPDFAAMGGFDKPILHGLASFGFSIRHVLKTFANNDVTKFKSVKVRFSKPVLPGQTLQTDMWKEGNRIHFQTKVIENGNICLTGAYVDLHSSTEAPAKSTSSTSSQGLMCDQIFGYIKDRVSSDPTLWKKVKGTFLWNITKDGKQAAQWTVDMKNAPGAVHQGEPKQGKAECIITVSDEIFADLATGKLNGQQAFLSGKMKVKGNIMLGQKLSVLFQEQSKL